MAKSSKKVSITAKPNVAPNGLKLIVTHNRTAMYINVEWGYPNKSTDKTNPRRMTSVWLRVMLDTDVRQNVTGTKTVKVRDTIQDQIDKLKKKKPMTKKIQAKIKKLEKEKDKNKLTKKSKTKVAVTTVTSGVKYKYITNVDTEGLKKKWSCPTVNLSDYFPTNGNTYIQSVVVQVQGRNTKCKNGWNSDVPYATKQVQFAAPKTPQVEKNYKATTRETTFTVTGSDPSDGTKPVYKMVGTFTVKKITYNESRKTYSDDTIRNENVSVDGLEDNRKFRLDANNFITLNQSITAELTMRAQGCCGESGSDSKSYKWAYPGDKKITSISTGGDLRTIYVSDDGKQDHRRTDAMWLERFHSFVPNARYIFDTDAKWEELVAAESGWEKCGDDFAGDNTRFVRSYMLDKQTGSSPYARTYYRVATKNEIFTPEGFYRYSHPFALPGFHRVPSAKNEIVDFLECVPEANGTSVRVVLAYRITTTQQGDPNSDGCEVTWSDDPNAWISNTAPGSFDMPDKDNVGSYKYQVDPSTLSSPDDQWLVPKSWQGVDERTEGGVVTDKYTRKLNALKNKYHYSSNASQNQAHTSKCYINGLSEGTKYYFKARRYLEETDDTPRTYSAKYTDFTANTAYEDEGSAPKLVEPSTVPKNINVKVKTAIPIGKDAEIVWTFEGEGTQSAWEVLWYSPSDIELDEKATASQSKVLPGEEKAKIWKVKGTATGTLLKEGQDASGYTVIPYYPVYNDDNTLRERGIVEFLQGASIFIAVRTKTTGDFGLSAPVQLSYKTSPEAALGYPAIVTALPFYLTIGTNDISCEASLKITAVNSASEQHPDGMFMQPEGSVVFSKKYTPTEIGWMKDNPPALPETDPDKWHDIDNVPYREDTSVLYRVYRSGSSYTVPEKDIPLYELKELGTEAIDPVKVWKIGGTDEPALPMEIKTSSNGYYSSNPSANGWYERLGKYGEYAYVETSDTSIPATSSKTYYDVSTGWSTEPPAYNPAKPNYYYAYKYSVANDEADAAEKTAYAWTSVQLDEGMSSLKADQNYQGDAIDLYRSSTDAGYFANVQIPRGLDFYDSKKYRISVVIKDTESKLDSRLLNEDNELTPLEREFEVQFERESLAPRRDSAYIFSDPSSLSTTIVLNRPILQPEGDVCDIYRVTPDGAEKILSDVSYGQTVTDLYAPYATNKVSYSNPQEKAINTRYRIANKTPDGMMAWDDYQYSLNHTAIRFDWGDPNENDWGYNHLEIPYNLNYTDTFKKYFEARHHLGQKKPVGFWVTNLDRTSSISTDIIKYDDPRDKEALRALASYSGPVMVRRPDGCAYLANVEVNKIQNSYDSQVVPVSFEITEIELTDEFRGSSGEYLNEEDKVYLNTLDSLPSTFATEKVHELTA